MPLPEHISHVLAAGADSAHGDIFTSRNPLQEADFAGWNAAVTIEDYMGWCTEGYALRLNVYGKPYRSESDDDATLVDVISDLYVQAVAISGLRTIRMLRPSVEGIMDRNPYLENPKQEAAFTGKFYGTLKDMHHGKRMNPKIVSAMLDQIPPYIDTLSYVAPTNTKTSITAQAFIVEDRAVAPDLSRPFGQRGGGRLKRPRNPTNGWEPDSRVPRVAKQIIHIATNQGLFQFNESQRVGYMAARIFDNVSTEEQLAEISWQGWEDQPWM